MLMRKIAALVALSTLLPLSACGGDRAASDQGGGDGGGGGSETTALTVGLIPILEVAPLFLGQEKDFFADENLELQAEFAQGGAAIIPAVLNNEFQVGYSNVVSLMLAQSQGLDLKIIAAGAKASADSSSDATALMVPAGSELRSVRDLEGKTIAVGAIRNINDVTIKAIVEAAGGDPESLKFVEVPIPDIPTALESGQVDAGVVAEPFVGAVEAAGGRVLTHHFAEAVPGLTITAYFTSAAYAEANPDVVQRFADAINESNTYAQEHNDEVAAVVPTYTRTSAEVAQSVVYNQWGPDLGLDTIEEIADLMVTYGLVQKRPDVDAMLIK
jgi:NitT/TauT family transport system substrate-binding protein